jgi:hypothetical protein
MFSLLHHTDCRDHPEVFSGFIPEGNAAGTLTRQKFTNNITKLVGFAVLCDFRTKCWYAS